jgi:hypothetical protein
VNLPQQHQQAQDDQEQVLLHFLKLRGLEAALQWCRNSRGLWPPYPHPVGAAAEHQGHRSGNRLLILLLLLLLVVVLLGQLVPALLRLLLLRHSMLLLQLLQFVIVAVSKQQLLHYDAG